MSPTDSNEEGYGESTVLWQFHERLLVSAGTRWDSYDTVAPEWFVSEAGDRLRAEARELLALEFDLSRPFVLKDPRVSRFLPFWLSVFETEHVAAASVLVIRHPIEVADSLARRDQLPRSLSLLAWLRHMLDAERSSRGIPRKFVRYDRVLANWRETIDSVSAIVGVNLAASSNTVGIDAFLRPDLRHHVATGTQWDAAPRIAEWLGSTWKALSMLADGDERDAGEAIGRLDGIRQEFDRDVEAFSADSLRVRAEAIRESARHTALIERLETERDRLEVQTTEQSKEIARLEHLVSDLRAEMSMEAAKVRSHIDGLEMECAALRASMSWRVTAPLRWLYRLMR
jgi:hypothetical protein